MNTWTEAKKLRVGDQVVSIQGDNRGYDNIVYIDTDPGDGFIWVKVEGIYGKGTYRLGQYEDVLIGPRPAETDIEVITGLLHTNPWDSGQKPEGELLPDETDGPRFTW